MRLSLCTTQQTRYLMPSLLLFNKPFRVLSQFTDEKTSTEAKRDTLANYIQQANVYPAGRLDYDSEGLLLLTDDGALQHYIANPTYKLPKTYWVQVEGDVNHDAIKRLCRGVQLKDGLTQPAQVEVIPEPTLWPRTPPVRFRQSIPTHWLSISITEGRNRQVRRMTAAVGLPTLRLVRVKIGDWDLGDLAPGEYTQLSVAPAPAPIKRSVNNRPEKPSHRRKKR
jgi:23S rRNA pseudouridine2457 synthase